MILIADRGSPTPPCHQNAHHFSHCCGPAWQITIR
jgi:hypothetical protein